MEEPCIWATIKQRDAVIFYDDDFEIFIDPDWDTHNYFEFEINAFGTVWDLLLTKPYRANALVFDQFDFKGLQSAVHVDGTINNALDVDKKWRAEVAIPLAAIGEAIFKNALPQNGTLWRVNFSRVDWKMEIGNGRYSKQLNKNGKPFPENNWVWQPMGKISLHEPEFWGIVQFAENNAL